MYLLLASHSKFHGLILSHIFLKNDFFRFLIQILHILNLRTAILRVSETKCLNGKVKTLNLIFAKRLGPFFFSLKNLLVPLSLKIFSSLISCYLGSRTSQLF